MHIALLNSIFAERCFLRGYCVNGKNIDTDKSKKVFETEITNVSIALKEIMDILKFDNEFKEFLEWKEKKEKDKTKEKLI